MTPAQHLTRAQDRSCKVRSHSRTLPNRPSVNDPFHKMLAREIGYRKPYRRKSRKGGA